jgi:23S rRNA pseudouridine1911/1915/1917 synthase
MRVEKRVEIFGRKISLLKVSPQTGRMHQIRVHASFAGHPIVGDKIYGSNEEIYLRFIETGLDQEMKHDLLLPRHALHASMMRVKIGGKEHHWSIDLASDLKDFLNDKMII